MMSLSQITSTSISVLLLIIFSVLCFAVSLAHTQEEIVTTTVIDAQQQQPSFVVGENWTDFAGFSWMNQPTAFEVMDHKRQVLVQTSPDSDFWRKVFYGFIHDNGNFYYRHVPNGLNWTLSVQFELDYENLYDQAGLMVRFNEKYWLKTGIEYVKGSKAATGGLQVSAVYTNDKSDWSVVSLDSLSQTKQSKRDKKKKKRSKKSSSKHSKQQNGKVTIFIRVRKLADCFIAEYKLREKDDYIMIRLGYLDPGQTPPPPTIQVGIVACSPTSKTTRAIFSNLNFAIVQSKKQEKTAEETQSS